MLCLIHQAGRASRAGEGRNAASRKSAPLIAAKGGALARGGVQCSSIIGPIVGKGDYNNSYDEARSIFKLAITKEEGWAGVLTPH